MKNTTNAAKVLKHFRENRYNRPEPISKFETGGVSNECLDTAGKPKPGCRKKFKSKSTSKETQGGILGGVLAGLAGLGAYKGYKYLKGKE